MRRGPALAENFLMTGGPPVKRLLIFFGSAGRRFFGSPGCCVGGCDIVVLRNAGDALRVVHTLRRFLCDLATCDQRQAAGSQVWCMELIYSNHTLSEGAAVE